ncbi:MAG: hypothetical protein K5644_04100 [Lachnospiraceae bacterium]|nr:hypothetical protein [Lachnospiraceae bacterium]
MGNSKFTIEKPDLLTEIKKEKAKKEMLEYFTKQIKKETNEDDIVVAWEKYKNAKLPTNV